MEITLHIDISLKTDLVSRVVVCGIEHRSSQRFEAELYSDFLGLVIFEQVIAANLVTQVVGPKSIEGKHLPHEVIQFLSTRNGVVVLLWVQGSLGNWWALVIGDVVEHSSIPVLVNSV